MTLRLLLLAFLLAARAAHAAEPVWQSHLAPGDWPAEWHLRKISFGRENLSIVPADDPRLGQALRVAYPRGSWSHRTSAQDGAPTGGAEFRAFLGIATTDHLYLRYYVRFAPGFDFVKGGKLPGLAGGAANTGGNIPDGHDGFTVRYMWRKGGDGEVYAYMPGSVAYGTSLGRGAWRFVPGGWHCLEQEVRLNTPGQRDGLIRVWFDEQQVYETLALRFRDVPELKIDSLLFCTFFGGADATWATPVDTTVDFANFAVSTSPIGK